MKKYFQTIKDLELDSLAIIFITIFVISIFGFHISKTSAQTSSSLSRNFNAVGSVKIQRNLTINSNLGIDQVPQYVLDVYGSAHFSGTVDTNTPGEGQANALATVNYIRRKIGDYVGVMPGVDW